eukprot:4065663-Lingulodinium_polyedra.AAC.1
MRPQLPENLGEACAGVRVSVFRSRLAQGGVVAPVAHLGHRSHGGWPERLVRCGRRGDRPGAMEPEPEGVGPLRD